MKKVFVIVFLFLLFISFIYFYLAIELELKYGIEHHGMKIGQLVDASFRIRTFTQILILIFLLLFAVTIFIFNKAFEKKG